MWSRRQRMVSISQQSVPAWAQLQEISIFRNKLWSYNRWLKAKAGADCCPFHKAFGDAQSQTTPQGKEGLLGWHMLWADPGDGQGKALTDMCIHGMSASPTCLCNDSSRPTSVTRSIFCYTSLCYKEGKETGINGVVDVWAVSHCQKQADVKVSDFGQQGVYSVY